MIRVLQVVNIMDRAGLETVIMNYYRKIDRAQIQFDFLTHRPADGAYDDEIHSYGGEIYRAPRLYPQNYVDYFVFMKKFFHEHPEYRIVHSHIDTMSAFPLSAAKKAGIPIRIGHSHSSRLDKDLKLPIKYLAKLFMPHAANIYCACGEKAGEFMYGHRNVHIIHNAIDTEKFMFDKNVRMKVRGELGLTDRFVVGHVGRYYYVKNQSFLIEIFKELKKARPDAALLLVGKGEDEEKLRRQVKEQALEEDVHFLIDRADVNRLYQAMDVFVMPSYFEGLPVVGVEAQSNGLPCLFSDKISAEILITDQAEMMSLSRNAKEWADKIMTLKRSESSRCLSQVAAAGYDVTTEATKLVKWYQQLSESECNTEPSGSEAGL